MAGYYERVGIVRNLQNNPTDRSDNALRSEAQTVTETIVGGFASVIELINYLIKNWQVTMVGFIALLLLIKRL